MFRRKKTPNTIQKVLNDAWIESENGIITNLPYAIAWEHQVKEATFVWIMHLKKVFGKPSINNGNGRSKIRKEWIISIDGVVALSMIGSRATITLSQREECLSRKLCGLLAVHTAFLSALFKESLIRIWRRYSPKGCSLGWRHLGIVIGS